MNSLFQFRRPGGVQEPNDVARDERGGDERVPGGALDDPRRHLRFSLPDGREALRPSRVHHRLGTDG